MISYTISNGVVKRTKLTKGGRATVSTQDVHKVFFKWASPGLFYVYFRSFQTNIAIFTTNICEKCPSSIRCRDSSPQPLEHGSLPITIRPGLPPNITSGLWGWFWNLIKKHKEEGVGLGKAFQFLMESVLLMFLQVGLSRYSKCAINWLSVDFSQRPISWFRCSFETVIDYLSF